jgi:hypothetical protein
MTTSVVGSGSHSEAYNNPLYTTSCQSEEEGTVSVDYRQLSVDKGIPLVEGSNRDRETDLNILEKTAGVTGATISHYLGEIVGDMPLLSKECFEWLFQKDCWDKKMLNKDTFQWNIIPSHIRRTVDKNTPLALDGDTLIVVSPDQVTQQELVIPLSLKNLKLLMCYPLNGSGNVPIFNKYCEAEAFEQSTPLPNGVRILFTRRDAVGDDLSKHLQKNYVESKGNQYHVTDAFSLVWKGCFDLWTCTRKTFDCGLNYGGWTSTTVLQNDRSYPLLVWVSITGDLFISTDNQDESAGVIPCVSAEVRL